jgi:tricarballylate dehydrogenase
MNHRAEAYDVVVIGGGNAGLSAAIAARQAGASVLLCESAPRSMRGGNSRHTRNLRVMHERPVGVLEGSYAEEEYWSDLLQVTAGRTDESLARMVIRGSKSAWEFLQRNGVRFQSALSGTLGLRRSNAFFLGGGKTLLNALYAHAQKLGIAVSYECEVRDIVIEQGRVTALALRERDLARRITPRTVVAASGGFQANLDWLEQAWGPAARNFVIRGTPYAQGQVLRCLLDQGVAAIGDNTQCHAVAVDGRSPRFDGGIVTRIDAVPFSIVVNREARRFYDEGEDSWPKRYAIWGRLIAQQPGQVAFAVLDSRARSLFIPPLYPPIEAWTLAELAQQLEIDGARLQQTVSEYNDACQGGVFDPSRLDGCTTRGLDPPKSHWARSIVEPPFLAYPLRPGITFTYLGVKVDECARVWREHGGPIPNLFAAGEIMAGSIIGQGYLAGFGMAIGTVFGRIAGEEAARHARA